MCKMYLLHNIVHKYIEKNVHFIFLQIQMCKLGENPAYGL